MFKPPIEIKNTDNEANFIHIHVGSIMIVEIIPCSLKRDLMIT